MVMPYTYSVPPQAQPRDAGDTAQVPQGSPHAHAASWIWETQPESQRERREPRSVTSPHTWSSAMILSPSSSSSSSFAEAVTGGGDGAQAAAGSSAGHFAALACGLGPASPLLACGRCEPQSRAFLPQVLEGADHRRHAFPRCQVPQLPSSSNQAKRLFCPLPCSLGFSLPKVSFWQRNWRIKTP